MSTHDYVLPRPLIDVSPERLGGQPVFTGRRVPVRAMFDYFKADHTLQDFLDAYPGVSRAHAIAVIRIAYAAATTPQPGTGGARAMAAILLDACVPIWLQRHLPGATMTSAKHALLEGATDAEVMAAMPGRYDVLVTLDRVFPVPEKSATLPFAMIVLRTTDQSPAGFEALAPQVAEAIQHLIPGDVVILG